MEALQWQALPATAKPERSGVGLNELLGGYATATEPDRVAEGWEAGQGARDAHPMPGEAIARGGEKPAESCSEIGRRGCRPQLQAPRGDPTRSQSPKPKCDKVG